MDSTGIYILTYPGDYHLSLPLIESLKYFAPSVPIMVIPGEGFDRGDHPFDVPVMADPNGFWAEMQHIDRKFWAFQGPFERFVYLDGDVICTRPLAPLLERVDAEARPSLIAYVRVEADLWQAAIADPSHQMHKECLRRVSTQLGSVDLLREFDPEYSPFAHYPFNAGVFASQRSTISEEAFHDLHVRESAFFARRLRKPFAWNDHSLFFADQGRINYLVEKLGIELRTLFPDGHYQWGGDASPVPVEDALEGRLQFSFVHWAGTPRPSSSVFCTAPLLWLFTLGFELPVGYGTLEEIPGYSLWRHFATRCTRWDRWDPLRVGGAVRWSARDLRLIVRMTVRRVAKWILRKAGLGRRLRG